MKKTQFLNLGLTEETAGKVMDIFKEELRSFIPKQRFDQVNDYKKELEKMVIQKEAEINELKGY